MQKAPFTRDALEMAALFWFKFNDMLLSSITVNYSLFDLLLRYTYQLNFKKHKISYAVFHHLWIVMFYFYHFST